jgi:hypothetical protein
LPTIQSRAFLMTPVTPRAYSGLAINRVRRDDARAALDDGDHASRSGLKSGRSRSEADRLDVGWRQPLGARSLLFSELTRKLPEIASIFVDGIAVSAPSARAPTQVVAVPVPAIGRASTSGSRHGGLRRFSPA